MKDKAMILINFITHVIYQHRPIQTEALQHKQSSWKTPLLHSDKKLIPTTLLYRFKIMNI